MAHNVQRFPARRHCRPEGPQAEPRTAAKVVRLGAVHPGANEAKRRERRRKPHCYLLSRGRLNFAYTTATEWVTR